MDATPHTWRGWLWRHLGRALLLAVLVPGWVLCALGIISAVGPSLLFTVQGWRYEPPPSTLPLPSTFGLGTWRRVSCNVRVASGAVSIFPASAWVSPPFPDPRNWRHEREAAVRGVLAPVRLARGHDDTAMLSAHWVCFASGVWLPIALFVAGPLLGWGLARIRARRRRPVAASEFAPSGRESLTPSATPWTPRPWVTGLAPVALHASLVGVGVLALGSLTGLAGVYGDANLVVYQDRFGQPRGIPPGGLRPNELVALQVQALSGWGAAQLGATTMRYAKDPILAYYDPLYSYPFWGLFRDPPTYTRQGWRCLSAIAYTRRLDFGGWLPCTLFVLLAGLRVALWLRGPYRRHYRRRHNLCLTCGYNLTGNTSGRCPECGTAVPGLAGDVAAPVPRA